MGKLLVDNTNRVHLFMHSQENVMTIVFIVCGVLFALGGILKLVGGRSSPQKVLTGSQKKLVEPIQSKKNK